MYGFNFNAFVNDPETYNIRDMDTCIVCYDLKIAEDIAEFIEYKHNTKLRVHDFIAIGNMVYPAAIEICKDIPENMVDEIKLLRNYALYHNNINGHMKRDLIKIARRKQAEIIEMM